MPLELRRARSVEPLAAPHSAQPVSAHPEVRRLPAFEPPAALLEAHARLGDWLEVLQRAADRRGRPAERLQELARESTPLAQDLARLVAGPLRGTHLGRGMEGALRQAIARPDPGAPSLAQAGVRMDEAWALSASPGALSEEVLADALETSAHGLHGLGAMLVELAARALAEAEHPVSEASLAVAAETARLVWAERELRERAQLFETLARRLAEQHRHLAGGLQDLPGDLE